MSNRYFQASSKKLIITLSGFMGLILVIPLIITALNTNTNSLSNAQTVTTPVGQTGSWNMVFDDEFTGTSVDLTKWMPNWLGGNATQITKGANSAEEECVDPKQDVVANGELDINAVARSCNGSNYASGFLETNGHFNFTYGYMEARIWMPGSGTISNWPAFWANGQNWPTDGEIDVMEGLGGQACWHFHNPNGGPGGCATGNYAGGWHVFAADWEAGSVTYYYDGKQVGQITQGVTSAPMYLILDYALSTSISPPVVVPATMKVDYVRVWKKGAGTNAPLPSTTAPTGNTLPVGTSPTIYYCMGSCPTMVPSATVSGPVPSSGSIGTTTMPSTGVPSTSLPSTSPCAVGAVANVSANVANHHGRGRRHHERSGMFSGSMQWLLQLLQQLFNLLFQLLGLKGGQIPGLPVPSGTVTQPSVSTPCPSAAISQPVPSVAPSTPVQPTIFGTSQAPSSAVPVSPSQGAAGTTTTLQIITFYGWPDNSPPGAAIAHPGLHQIAGGTGTFADPVTFAAAVSAQGTFPPGKKVYVPYLQKYFIMEDDCANCSNSQMDIWTNSNGTNNSGVLACENNLTRNNVQVEINPPDGRTVSTTPLFNISTGACFAPTN